MGSQRVDQSSFVQGALDERLWQRTDFADYYKCAKTVNNCMIIPQGGVQRRFGTEYVDTLAIATAPQYCEINTLAYNDNAIYLLLWEAASLKIYLENTLIQTLNVANGNAPQYAQEDIATLRFSQVETRMMVCTGNYAPQQLVRAADGVQTISAINAVVANSMTATTGYAAGLVLPVQFATGGALPTTSPQIFAGRDYFIRTVTATAFQVYSTSADAIAQTNAYLITVLGNTSTVNVQNTWSLANIVFKFLPSYDFTGGYSGAGFTFTPTATTGSTNLTASGNIYTVGMIGGVFKGGGGIARITAITSATVAVVLVLEAFNSTSAIVGNQCFLGEPAWSTIRGWPRSPSFFQNRLVLAGTASLPNGQWLSVISDAFNFDDSETFADNAISWYPASGGMSYIQSMTSARSLLVHSNSGNFSTPVQTEAVTAPLTYVLTEQNKFGVGTLQPVFIDNQIFFVDKSGNNIINMIWEFTQSSYVTNNVSIKASSLLSNPVDMAAFSEPTFVDGSYVIFINDDGTLCVLQTLSEEGILAFSSANTNTYPSTGVGLGYTVVPSKFVKVNAAQSRCWFIVQRTSPATGGNVYTIEEADFTYYTDCSKTITNAVATTAITGLAHLNGQVVQVVADGVVLSDELVTGGAITIEEASNVVQVGLRYQSLLVPLPPVNPQFPGMLYMQKHIRNLYISYYQTIGATVQGYGIPIQKMQNIVLGQPTLPANGVFEYTLMAGWGGASTDDIQIIQEAPLPMTILALSYILEM